jgi:uncharacterized protein YjiS (DUF1127 family)
MAYRTFHTALFETPSLRAFLSKLQRRARADTSLDALPDQLLRDIGVSRLEIRFASRHKLEIR